MKVSIIVPVFNVEPYIQRCLDSIRFQDYADIEVILVDDRGNDGSVQIANKYIHEYKLDWKIYNNHSNLGVSASRNVGLSYATGEYVYFMDSDDVIKEGCISELVESCSGEDIIIGNYETHKVDKIEVSCLTDWTAIGQHEIQDMYLSGNCYVMPWNKLCRRAFLVENRLFFKEGVPIHEDMLWTLQTILLAESISTISNITYEYHVRQGSAMTTLSTENDVLAYIIIFNEILLFIKENNIMVTSSVYEIIEAKKSAMLFSLLQNGNKLLFQKYYPSLRGSMIKNPIIASLTLNISIKSLIRDLHYILPISIGAWYKRISFWCGFSLWRRDIIDPFWKNVE